MVVVACYLTMGTVLVRSLSQQERRKTFGFKIIGLRFGRSQDPGKRVGLMKVQFAKESSSSPKGWGRRQGPRQRELRTRSHREAALPFSRRKKMEISRGGHFFTFLNLLKIFSSLEDYLPSHNDLFQEQGAFLLKYIWSTNANTVI